MQCIGMASKLDPHINLYDWNGKSFKQGVEPISKDKG